MPVIIHTSTGVCRKHETFDQAWLWLREDARNEKYLFCGPDDFDRIRPKGRQVLIGRLKWWSRFRWGEDRVPNWDALGGELQDRQNKTLWVTVNKIADPVTIPPPWLSGKHKQGNVIDLELCKSLLQTKEWEMMDLHAPWAKPRVRKPPRQLRAIVQELVINDNGFLNEAQLEDLMSSLTAVVAMKTRQDSWRIFRYYRPILEQMRVIR